MKKLTLGARIKSLLPTLSISLPAVITGIIIFTETNLIDPLTSLLSKTEDESKKEEDTKGEGDKDGEKGANEQEKSEKKGKGKGGKSEKGDGTGDSLNGKDDKETGKGKDALNEGKGGEKDGVGDDEQQNGDLNAEGKGEGDNVSESLGVAEVTESGGPEEDNTGLESGTGNQEGKENEGEERDNSTVISGQSADGQVEEKQKRSSSVKRRGVATAFWGYLGEIHEDW